MAPTGPYYSHYVGDVFGALLASEGLMAFFLESTFVGLFFFGWDRLSQVQHLVVTWLLALGSSLSALWILIANAWMQNPVGSEFNIDTLRMELTSFSEIFFNPVAQVKFVHTVAAGYVTGAMFVLGISSYYILNRRDLGFARRSFAISAAFGFASALSVIVLGDESGYTSGHTQKIKLAAIESEWETHKPPAGFTIFGIPDQEQETTHYSLRIPYLLGLIATRSIDEEVLGLKDLRQQNVEHIKRGLLAQKLLSTIRQGNRSEETLAAFDEYQHDLGYALLLKKYVSSLDDANEAIILKAADDTIPRVAPLFWSFRLMVLCGFMMLFVFSMAFFNCARRHIDDQRWLLKLALWSIPLPWIASELGWVVAEYGRQPWSISGVLPTFLGTSSHSVEDLYFSFGGLLAFYTFLLVVELFLMFKYARMGPSALHTGHYHFEQGQVPQEG